MMQLTNYSISSDGGYSHPQSFRLSHGSLNQNAPRIIKQSSKQLPLKDNCCYTVVVEHINRIKMTNVEISKHYKWLSVVTLLVSIVGTRKQNI
jgi:hypothetical protein